MIKNMVATNTSAFENAFKDSFSGFDWGSFVKNVLFWTYYFNDLLTRGVTAILKGVGLPYTNYHGTVILVIVYCILFYFALKIAAVGLKWGAIIGIIWLLLGFFKI